MYLIVTIPAFNEQATLAQVIQTVPKTIKGIKKIDILVWSDGSTDKTTSIAKKAGAKYVFSNKKNLGLARTFQLATTKALQLGADIVVNTDADNQYDQTQIPLLLEPILQGKADVVTGNRQIENLTHMSQAKKYGNLWGSRVIRFLTGLTVADASSGFRAYTAQSLEKLHVHSKHTYTHETLIQIAFSDLALVEVPITFRRRQATSGHSRLIQGVLDHILKSGTTILRTVVLYRAFSIINALAAMCAAVSLIGFTRFFYFFLQGNDNKIYSLLFGIFFALSAVNLATMALLADLISRNIIFMRENHE